MSPPQVSRIVFEFGQIEVLDFLKSFSYCDFWGGPLFQINFEFMFFKSRFHTRIYNRVLELLLISHIFLTDGFLIFFNSEILLDDLFQSGRAFNYGYFTVIVDHRNSYYIMKCYFLNLTRWTWWLKLTKLCKFAVVLVVNRGWPWFMQRFIHFQLPRKFENQLFQSELFL